jgi:hypothetical protein
VQPRAIRRLVLAAHFGVWRINLAFPHVGESPNLGATQGGMAWVALLRLSPKHKELVIRLVLLNYMTYGLFS